MLNGPTYENLEKYFWVMAEIYDKHVTRLEEDEKVLIDPSLDGKTRAEMGLKEFTRTKIHSNIMGIPVTITEEDIGKACRIDIDGAFQWNLNKKTSSWKATVCETLFNNNARGKNKDMQKEHKVLQKLMQECFLPKGGWVDQLSPDHKVFLHFFVRFEKVNLPRYIFHHMLWVLKESQDKERKFVHYGRLLSEIFHQGGILEALRLSNLISDEHLGTVVGKYINATTLKNMYLVEEVTKLPTDLKESMILSDLMVDFPPISNEDPPALRAAYVYDHFQKTGEIISYNSIEDTMYHTPLKIATKKRKSKKASSEAVEVEASEPKPKKAKKEKDVPQVNIVGHDLQTIQEEVEDLVPIMVLDKRTRGGTSTGSSGAIPAQPKIQKKKNKKNVRKMKVSKYVLQEDVEIKASNDLITRMERNKKATADASLLNKELVIASEIDVPAESLLKESTAEDAQKVVELPEEIKDLVTEQSGELLKEVQREEVGTSDA
jgi:hypothetical protein